MCADESTRITQIIQRADGSEVKIVAQAYWGTGLKQSIGVDVFRRESCGHHWVLCSDRPHPDWRTMSIDDYLKYGRPEKLQYASHSEILKVSSAIGRPLSCLKQ